MQITVLGLDLATTVVPLHGVDEHGHVVLHTKEDVSPGWTVTCEAGPQLRARAPGINTCALRAALSRNAAPTPSMPRAWPPPRFQAGFPRYAPPGHSGRPAPSPRRAGAVGASGPGPPAGGSAYRLCLYVDRLCSRYFSWRPPGSARPKMRMTIIIIIWYRAPLSLSSPSYAGSGSCIGRVCLTCGKFGLSQNGV